MFSINKTVNLAQDCTESYSVLEMSKKTGLSAHTLRYYEHAGLMNNVLRNKSGHRVYSQGNLEWIRFLICMRSTGMPIADLQKYISLLEQGESTIEQRKAILLAHKKNIEQKHEEIQNCLVLIEHKLAHYAEIEKNLRT